MNTLLYFHDTSVGSEHDCSYVRLREILKRVEEDFWQKSLFRSRSEVSFLKEGTVLPTFDNQMSKVIKILHYQLNIYLVSCLFDVTLLLIGASQNITF